ncbi:MAG TPA: STAS/SEC14 domain-containing protein [Flavipsychrobacter sp.]|nr:STAS/SEC14 domain-containing protein [Flavipsychrobacter sp.]
MITQLHDLPENVVGFTASGTVSADDLKNILIPAVDKHLQQYERLNYVLELHTGIADFTAGAWLQDMWLGLKHITQWNKAAIITDDERVIKFTDAFSSIIPGEFKGFKKAQRQQAIQWAGE